MKLRSALHTPEKSGLPSASFGAGPLGTALPLALPLPPSSCAIAGEMVSSATAAAPAIRNEPTRRLFMQSLLERDYHGGADDRRLSSAAGTKLKNTKRTRFSSASPSSDSHLSP